MAYEAKVAFKNVLRWQVELHLTKISLVCVDPPAVGLRHSFQTAPQSVKNQFTQFTFQSIKSIQ